MLTWMFRGLAVGSALALAACAAGGGAADVTTATSAASAPALSGPNVVKSGEPARNRCDGQGAQAVVGGKLDDSTLKKALAAAGADEARLLRPDSVVTKEYQMGRVNVVVDENGRVSRAYCG